MENYDKLIKDCIKTGGYLRYIGKTVLGYDIPLLSKGNRSQPRILLIGGVHAREHITIPLLLRLFTDYNGAYPIDCVPVLNIDGTMLAKNGLDSLPLKIKVRKKLLAINGGNDFSLWKANINGVDINVNFDAGWGEGLGNVFMPSSASYVGAYPHSEPETKAVVDLLKKREYALVVAYHSKGEEVYFGFRKDNRYRTYAEKYADKLNYVLKETLSSAGGIKDYWTKTTGRLGLTVEIGNDKFSHPYPVSELDNLIAQHQGTLELLTQMAEDLWIKYSL